MKLIARNTAECKSIPLSWDNPRVMVLCDLLLRGLIGLQEHCWELEVRGGGPLSTALLKHPLCSLVSRRQRCDMTSCAF